MHVVRSSPSLDVHFQTDDVRITQIHITSVAVLGSRRSSLKRGRSPELEDNKENEGESPKPKRLKEVVGVLQEAIRQLESKGNE